jgi:hypothetical protein
MLVSARSTATVCVMSYMEKAFQFDVILEIRKS